MDTEARENKSGIRTINKGHKMTYTVKFLDGSAKLFDTLVEQDLRGADFRLEDLTGVSFTGSDCTDASFSDATLTRAGFCEANCTGASFVEANCTKADFRGANCTGANFYEANCTVADFRQATLTRADFRDANCTGASFYRANCTGVNFFGANCTMANFCHATLAGADFDFSSWPLWCGSLNVKIDKKIACQLIYHTLRAMQGCEDEEAQSILQIDQVVKFANQFHRANECGLIKKKED